jgi:hypothetical protein
MIRFLTENVINPQCGHKRNGHLSRNRYKSILCADISCLLELTRHLCLNSYAGRFSQGFKGTEEIFMMVLGYPIAESNPRPVRSREEFVHNEKFDRGRIRNESDVRDYIDRLWKE